MGGIILTALAPVAQLDRVSDYESEGRGFESLPAHHSLTEHVRLFFYCYNTERPEYFAGGTRKARPAVLRPGRARQSSGLSGRARGEGPLPAHHSLTEHVRSFFIAHSRPAAFLPAGTKHTLLPHSKAPAFRRGLFPVTDTGPAGGRGGSAPRCAPPARRRRSPRPARRSRRRGRPSPDRGD